MYSIDYDKLMDDINAKTYSDNPLSTNALAMLLQIVAQYKKYGCPAKKGVGIGWTTMPRLTGKSSAVNSKTAAELKEKGFMDINKGKFGGAASKTNEYILPKRYIKWIDKPNETMKSTGSNPSNFEKPVVNTERKEEVFELDFSAVNDVIAARE